MSMELLRIIKWGEIFLELGVGQGLSKEGSLQ